jgi:hydroxymethylglutaryl-CoA lyase
MKRLVEVSARDGIQSRPNIYSVAQKTLYIKKLIECGVTNLEVGSFVSPKVKQMVTTREVIKGLDLSGVNSILLVGNKKYALEALNYPVATLGVFTSISESFSRKNEGRSLEDSYQNCIDISKIKGDKKLRGYISCSFGCPYEGKNIKTSTLLTIELVQKLLNLGYEDISIADTIGTARSEDISYLLFELSKKVELSNISLHLHSHPSSAREKISTAIASGIGSLDTGLGGGGCSSLSVVTDNINTIEALHQLPHLRTRYNIAELNRSHRLLE